MTLAKFWQQDPEYFRTVETEVVIEMCSQDQKIISFGAGSLIKQANQEAACHNSLVVYLQTSVEELWRRIQADPGSTANRPNLSRGGIEEVALHQSYCPLSGFVKLYLKSVAVSIFSVRGVLPNACGD